MKLFADNQLTKKEIARTALFGALWGIVEISAGNTLHLAKVPFRGLIMALIAMAMLVCAKRFAPFRGSLLLIGAIAATFKAGSMGGFVLTPMIAIFAESVIAEVVFLFAGYSWISSTVVGATGLAYTFAHGVLMQVFFFGFNIFNVYGNILSNITGNNMNIYLILSILAVLHLIFGAASGLIGFSIAQKTDRILQSEAV
jgi:hypothetical protein